MSQRARAQSTFQRCAAEHAAMLARAALAIGLAALPRCSSAPSGVQADQAATASAGTNAASPAPASAAALPTAAAPTRGQSAAGIGAQPSRAAAVSGSAGSPAPGAAATSSGMAPASSQSQAGAASAAGRASTMPAAGSDAGTVTGPAGKSAPAAGSGAGSVTSPAAGSSGAAGQPGSASSSSPGQTPVYRIPLRLHVGMSELSDAELIPILEEVNKIWLSQAGICFEIEVTESEANRSDGFDFRYTSGRIPGSPSANGVTQDAHTIWSVDHPRLSDAPNPVMFPTARTTAHELGHALGLAHENPPPSSDCASPCYCAMRGDDCDDYLLRSGTMGFFLSPPEVEITRQRAAKLSMSDRAPLSCGMASIQR